MHAPRLVASLTLPVMLSLLLTAFSFPASAQQAEPVWQKIAPPGEEFTVMLPGKPEVETSKEPYGQLTLVSTYYTLATDDGPLFMVASLTGMQTLAAMLSEKDRLKSFTDGFRESFLKVIRAKGLEAEMTYRRDLKLNGHLGMEYDMTMGAITGLARVYSTRNYFYALMIFNARAGDARSERFMTSFALREETPRIIGPAPSASATGEPPPPVNTTTVQGPMPRAPISGGVLNGKAISMPKPAYTTEAMVARATGTVVVQIMIDEEGNVIEARALSGHRLLRDSAVQAARGAKFPPTRLSGQPVKVSGTLSYCFISC
jgi:TonB family protein